MTSWFRFRRIYLKKKKILARKRTYVRLIMLWEALPSLAHKHKHWRNGFNRTKKHFRFRLDKYGDDFAPGYTVTFRVSKRIGKNERNTRTRRREEKKKKTYKKNGRCPLPSLMDCLSYPSLTLCIAPFAPLRWRICADVDAENVCTMRDVCCQPAFYFSFHFSAFSMYEKNCKKIKCGPEIEWKIK